MDDRGRIARPVGQTAGAPAVRPRGVRAPRGWRSFAISLIRRARLPRGAGIAATAVFLSASAGAGVVIGGHLPAVLSSLQQARDAAANAAGFEVAAVAVSGLKQVSREQILSAAGISDESSLLFLDVEQARTRLKANPWIAEATVRKLYPDRLEIAVEERQAFALWQIDGKVSVIAPDGTVVSAQADPQLAHLPFVVGRGAQRRAREFLALLDRYPAIRDQVRACILVAERRWNLRLKNGIDVRMPDHDVEQALSRLVELDRKKNLLTRDIVAVDLRLPDRVTVRLSDEAALARELALKEKVKRKGGDA